MSRSRHGWCEGIQALGVCSEAEEAMAERSGREATMAIARDMDLAGGGE